LIRFSIDFVAIITIYNLNVQAEVLKLFVLFPLLFITTLQAHESHAVALAKKLHLSAGSKAIVQWERVFNSPKKIKRYKIDTLTPKDQEILKEYLVNHAIDSDQPTIAGI